MFVSNIFAKLSIEGITSYNVVAWSDPMVLPPRLLRCRTIQWRPASRELRGFHLGRCYGSFRFQLFIPIHNQSVSSSQEVGRSMLRYSLLTASPPSFSKLSR